MRKFPIPALESLYGADDRDRAVFGDLYHPVGPFEHGKPVQIVTLPKTSEDGQDVTILEERWPARFFIIRAEATPDRTFPNLGIVPGKPAVEVSTGSSMEEFAMLIARHLANGMVGIRFPGERHGG